MAVQAAAAPRAVRSGRPDLRTSGKTAPNNAIESAVSSVSAPQASEPKSMIHDRVMPNPTSP